jgi:endonuclease/exonuclease/phosphatase (EEP) superfamily protein YafD
MERRIVALGYLTLFASVLGAFGAFSWYLDLLSHFRPQYALLLFGAGLALLRYQRSATSAVFLFFAILNLLPILPLFFGSAYAANKAHDALRIKLINVHTTQGNPQKVLQAVKESSPDILVLQEINSRWVQELADLKARYPHNILEPREDNFGIGLFSRLPIASAEIQSSGSAGVPTIIADIGSPKGKLRVIAAHPLPPVSHKYWQLRNNQLEELEWHVASEDPTILIGDLNVTPWNYYFQKLLKSTGLRDSAKGFGIQPTWPTGNPVLWIPIDHCLHSPDIVVVERQTGPSVGSDHYPLVVDFFIDSQKP